MVLKLYGLKKCTTCQKAEAWLKDQRIAYEFTDVKEAPPSVPQVTGWAKALGGWEKLINRAGYTWRGLEPAETQDLTEAKAVKLAARHPSLIRRPLIEYPDGSFTTGFSGKVRARIAEI